MVYKRYQRAITYVSDDRIREIAEKKTIDLLKAIEKKERRIKW